MLEEQSLLTHYRWEDVCKFSSDMSMVNADVVENLWVAALRDIRWNSNSKEDEKEPIVFFNAQRRQGRGRFEYPQFHP
jgi:hypothetical protein